MSLGHHLWDLSPIEFCMINSRQIKSYKRVCYDVSLLMPPLQQRS